MHSRRTDSAACPSAEFNRPLPAQLANSLKPEIGKALMHGARRCILRILNQDAAPQSTRDLQKAFPRLSLSGLNYHVLVLADCGTVSLPHEKGPLGSSTRLVSSNVADDPQLVAVLRATNSLDNAR